MDKDVGEENKKLINFILKAIIGGFLIYGAVDLFKWVRDFILS